MSPSLQGGGFKQLGLVQVRVSTAIAGDAHGDGGVALVDREQALSEVVLQWMLGEATARGCGDFWRPDWRRPREDVDALLAGTMLPLDPADPDTHDSSRQLMYRILPINTPSVSDRVSLQCGLLESLGAPACLCRCANSTSLSRASTSQSSHSWRAHLNSEDMCTARLIRR